MIRPASDAVNRRNGTTRRADGYHARMTSPNGTLYVGNGPWCTLGDGPPGARRGADMNDPGTREGWAVLSRNGVIVAAGPPDVLRTAHPDAHVVDLGDRLVTPGLVDPHTHPVFHGTREDEFEMRNLGRTYVDIALSGGGIRKSVRLLRAADDAVLARNVAENADAFLRLGTTTIEAKSGYGLSLEDELRSLRAIRDVAAWHPLTFVPTFLGAHEFPDAWRERRDAWVDHLIDDMLPRVAAERLAVACDVFCEAHVFTVAQSRRLLLAAKKLGLATKVHADEITPCGGAELAAEVGAASADHLVHVSDAGMDAMAAAGTVPILLPATSWYLRLPKDAPGDVMKRKGLPIALATDFNPGSSPTRSLPLVMSMACVRYGFTAAEALTAVTVNAACAIGLGDRVGRLVPGYACDLVAWDLPNLRSLPYRFGENHVATVVKSGRVVVERGR